MSKLENYLVEQVETSRVNKIPDMKAVELIKKHAYTALDQFQNYNRCIERWARTAQKVKYGFLDARKLELRRSRNTVNYYTLIMNEDPIWSAFPKRQIIATYTLGSAPQMIDTFIIFPYDTTKIGVCSSDDLWVSFKVLNRHTGLLGANLFNGYITSLFRESGRQVHGADKSLKVFKEFCKGFDKWYEEMFDGNAENAIVSLKNITFGAEKYSWFYEKVYKGDLYKALVEVYNPDGFKIITSKGYSSMRSGVEVWFDGPAVYINATKIERIIELIKRNE